MNKKKLTIIVIIFAIIGIGTGFLATDIAMKKSEERTPYFHVVEIGEFEDDPAVWGKNFPLQYDTYFVLSMVAQSRFLVHLLVQILEMWFHKINFKKIHA